MRSEKEKAEIVELFSEPAVVENFLSPKEVEQLVNIFKETTDFEKIFKNTGPITLDIDFTKDPFKSLIERIKSVIGDFEIISGFFFYTEYPHIIHNDDSFELPKTYKGITLPLYYEGTDHPYLCFFHQYYLKGPAKFFKGGVNLPEYYNKNISDYIDVEGLVDTQFPIDTYRKYFTHLKYEWLSGLSFDKALPWKPGSMLYFNSVKLHSASDFLKQGIKYKLGISIFTKRT